MLPELSGSTCTPQCHGGFFLLRSMIGIRISLRSQFSILRCGYCASGTGGSMFTLFSMQPNPHIVWQCFEYSCCWTSLQYSPMSWHASGWKSGYASLAADWTFGCTVRQNSVLTPTSWAVISSPTSISGRCVRRNDVKIGYGTYLRKEAMRLRRKTAVISCQGLDGSR